MRKVIRLTESDLVRIVKRVIKEETNLNSLKYKVGDRLYSQSFSPGNGLKFKITKISNDGDELYIEGIIIGIKGEFDPESVFQRSAKVGDPLHVRVQVNNPEESYQLYLPKTGGEMEYASGIRFSKDFIKI